MTQHLGGGADINPTINPKSLTETSPVGAAGQGQIVNVVRRRLKHQVCYCVESSEATAPYLLALPGSDRSLTWCTGGSRAECIPFLSFLPFSSAPNSAS